MLGGAALTRRYVEKDLREVYEGRLFYGKDAFEGLAVMERLGEIKTTGEEDLEFGFVPTGRELPEREGRDDVDPSSIPDRSPDVMIDNPIFEPPFWGSQVVKGIAIDDIAAYINETAIFRNQWQFRPEKDGGVDEAGNVTKETDDEFKDCLLYTSPSPRDS